MDVIRQVGPQGQFLSTTHTAKNYRKEHWLPELSNRLPLDFWKSTGKKTLGDKAIEKAKMILKEHQAEPLGEGVQKTLETIRNGAVADLADITFES
jgi:trimethylamine--corrinoid protein Co-methyltransferase